MSLIVHRYISEFISFIYSQFPPSLCVCVFSLQLAKGQVIVWGKITTSTGHWTTSTAQQVAAKMIGRLFRAHGEFCASHPWEVIVALLTITACMLTVDKSTTTLDAANSLSNAATVAATAAGSADAAPPPIIANQASASATSSRHRPCHGWSQSCDGLEAEYNAADVILMTIVRCTAVLYCYYQFCSLHRLGSKYVLGKLPNRRRRIASCGARVLIQLIIAKNMLCLSASMGCYAMRYNVARVHAMFGKPFS